MRARFESLPYVPDITEQESEVRSKVIPWRYLHNDSTTKPIKRMRDKAYKGYCFKLHAKTIRRLRILKLKKGLSWNLIFKEFLDEAEKT